MAFGTRGGRDATASPRPGPRGSRTSRSGSAEVHGVAGGVAVHRHAVRSPARAGAVDVPGMHGDEHHLPRPSTPHCAAAYAYAAAERSSTPGILDREQPLQVLGQAGPPEQSLPRTPTRCDSVTSRRPRAGQRAQALGHVGVDRQRGEPGHHVLHRLVQAPVELAPGAAGSAAPGPDDRERCAGSRRRVRANPSRSRLANHVAAQRRRGADLLEPRAPRRPCPTASRSRRTAPRPATAPCVEPGRSARRPVVSQGHSGKGMVPPSGQGRAAPSLRSCSVAWGSRSSTSVPETRPVAWGSAAGSRCSRRGDVVRAVPPPGLPP